MWADPEGSMSAVLRWCGRMCGWVGVVGGWGIA